MHDIEQVKWVTGSQEHSMSLGRLRKCWYSGGA
jgi:hypothetical protein